MKVVQEILGHTQLATTADLYTSVLDQLTHQALTAAAATINQHRHTTPANSTHT
jgi:site-specific recombinase XerD